jgi:cytochrome c biogenesis protein CcmG/thiol:disulfide interchange protein DsbE
LTVARAPSNKSTWGALRMKLSKIVVAAAVTLSASSASAAKLKVGEPAPDAELVLVDGKHIHLSELHGQVVVLNYWATWCVPCRIELPLLNSYYITASKNGWPIKIFAVATEENIPEYRLKKLFSLMSILPTDRIRGGPFGDVDALPTNYVIDKSGVLRYAKAGAFDLDGLNSVLIPLMKEPAPVR